MLNTKINHKILKYNDIREYYQNSCKNDLKYGLEYERVSICSSTLKSADYDSIEKIIKSFAQIKGWGLLYDEKTLIGALGEGSSISLEPGCQMELSLKAQENLYDIKKYTHEIISLLDRIAKFYNVEFLPYGISPLSTYQNIEIVNKQRYKIMADYLPTFGKFAPVMMRETAGVQLNIDYKSESDAINKIKMLNIVMPFMTGFFANSPIRNNKITNYKSFRALAWKYTGKNRCGIFYDNISCFEDYINAILNVPMLFIERNGEKINISGKITFGEFMKKGYSGHFATIEDYILHSSLCFPDIRLKNCIEIRNHDSQNMQMTLAICAFYKGILCAQIKELMEYFKDISINDIENIGFLAAKYGIGFEYKKYRAQEIVKKLFDIAYKNLQDNEKCFLDPALEMLSKKESPADKIIKLKIKNACDLIAYLRK